MSGCGKSKQFFWSVCVIAYAPHSFRIRFAFVPHTLTHTLTHTLASPNALQALYFSWVAMSVSL